MKHTAILDLEVYTDYFLASFKSVEKGTYREFEMYAGHPLDREAIKKLMTKFTTVTFNGDSYDNIVLTAAIKGWNNLKLKQLSDEIITGNDASWQVARKHKLYVPRTWDTIDLIQVAPGAASLKIYGGRLHSLKLQDLPIEPSASINPSQRDELRLYCRNDLITTLDLYNKLTPQIKLREQLTEKYDIDLRSKSDAQIAEAIIRQYLDGYGVSVGKRTTEVKPFKYRLPDWVTFESSEFNEMLQKVIDCTFQVSDKGSVVMPKELNKAVEYKGAKYKFGIGGLHSQEKRQVVKPSTSQLFGEFDVASMYPSIIIEQGLFPAHLTEKFLTVYSTIKDERLKAKRNGDHVVNAAYKILLNGSYGKFGSKYSFLYSPELLIQTTITGQLSLLMLIEKMSLAGGKVVSANTDGVNVLYNKTDYNNIHAVQFEWEMITGYELEYTPYAATFNRDVNNYIAIKDNGIKGKGAFAEPNIMKNPTNEICILAVKEYLNNDVPIEQTINQCKDITKFINVRTVQGGAMWRGEYLGKAIRWYYSTDGDLITYKKNGNKVPKSDHAKPLMDLCENLPVDLSYQWYIDETNSMLKGLGL